MKIYLAGPLFSAAERAFNVLLADRLRMAGHKVWLPQESEQRSMSARQIFEKDVEGVDWAEVVVANINGPRPRFGDMLGMWIRVPKKTGDRVSYRFPRRR